MAKDHSDNERRNPLPPHGLLFPLAARVILYVPPHKQNITYHGLYYTSCGALAGTITGWNDNSARITAHMINIYGLRGSLCYTHVLI